MLSGKQLAFNALLEWEKHQVFISDTLDRHHDVDKREKAFALRLAYGVLRNKLWMEYQWQPLVRKNPGLTVRILLQLTCYHLFMDDPENPHALSEWVNVAKSQCNPFEVKFFNGVMRQALRNGLQNPQGQQLKDLSVRYSVPLWMLKKWHQEKRSLQKILPNLNAPAPHWLRWKHESSAEEKIFGRYQRIDDGIATWLDSPDFKQGKVSVQDPAAFLVVKLLGDLGERGEEQGVPQVRVLDMCAAPGGKTALIFELFPQLQAHQVVASDVNVGRLQKIWDVRSRLQHPLSCVVAARGEQLPFKQLFTHIIMDVPCSNLGVMHRRPEARWSATQEKLKQLQELQKSLLVEANKHLAPGGVLVYATCSPESEETSDVVDWFLKKYSYYHIDHVDKWIGQWGYSGKWLRLFPGQQDYDGFFAVRLQKN